ncbi:hypothetical protein DPMN_170041 [Dreissena polymorpha]|uniref:Uncharacterized protein n=1 Tax=Dreissena polymorpha TaxID=45954 RepID=A0A9D4DYK0_DREPO|nr:hypothetical protein DPMN_170041 [Dreissena polymorpha]
MKDRRRSGSSTSRSYLTIACESNRYCQLQKIDLPVNCCTPTKEEICNRIKQLKNGKVTASEIIPTETMNPDVQTSFELLHPLLSKI